MDKTYFDAIKSMESANVERDYILGWIDGYLENPEREEQRVTEAYEAGREAGGEKSTDGYEDWVK